jgi:small subunit ribosomal protein S6
MWIVGGDLNDTATDDSINEVRDLLEKNQGIKVDHISRWLHRKLSYPIEEFDNGTYFISVFESEPSSIKTLDNVLKDNESIIRHLITKKENLKPYKSKSKLKSD